MTAVKYCIAALIILSSFPSNVGAQVAVRAGFSDGVGLPRSRRGECFVIAPAHVLPVGIPIIITGPQQRQVQAIEVRRYESDIAILRTSESWPCDQAASWRRLPRYFGEARIRGLDPTGRGVQTLAEIESTNDEIVQLRPLTPVQDGTSGSGVYTADNRLIGMVITLSDGRIQALTINKIMSVTETFFHDYPANPRELPVLGRLRRPAKWTFMALAAAAGVWEMRLRGSIDDLQHLPYPSGTYDSTFWRASVIQDQRNIIAKGAGVAGAVWLVSTLASRSAPSKSASAADHFGHFQLSGGPNRVAVHWRF